MKKIYARSDDDNQTFLDDNKVGIATDYSATKDFEIILINCPHLKFDILGHNLLTVSGVEGGGITAWVRHDDLYESYGGGLSKPSEARFGLDVQTYFFGRRSLEIISQSLNRLLIESFLILSLSWHT